MVRTPSQRVSRRQSTRKSQAPASAAKKRQSSSKREQKTMPVEENSDQSDEDDDEPSDSQASVPRFDTESAGDLLGDLCMKLHHPEAAPVLIKKIVLEGWIKTVADLERVPPKRFVKWGIPLKLIKEMTDYFNDAEAAHQANSLYAWWNYSGRVALQRWSPAGYFSGLYDQSLKRTRPAEWAVLRLQRSFRARRARRKRDMPTYEEIAFMVMPEDCRCLGEEEMAALRRRRAEERLRHAVRIWRAKRELRRLREERDRKAMESGKELGAKASRATARRGSSMRGSIVEHLMRLAPPQVEPCEVQALMDQVGFELERSRDDMRPHVHRLVTLNWIEALEDLALVEDEHWSEWEVPANVVQRLKAGALEKEQEALSSGFYGAASSVGSLFPRCAMRVFGLFGSTNQ